MENINILYVCENQYNTNTDIEYIKHYQLKKNPNSKINIDQQIDRGKKYDIIYLINCIDNQQILKYIPFLKINSILYINNLTKSKYDSLYTILKSNNFTYFNMVYPKNSYQNYINLIQNYYSMKYIIDTEINKGLKKEHWIWYVYPTTKIGENDKKIKTNIDPITAKLLINNSDWINTHNLIHAQIIKQIKLFPTDDIDRMCYFINFMNIYEPTFIPNYLNDLLLYILTNYYSVERDNIFSNYII